MNGSYDNSLFAEGVEYTVGINDGNMFKQAIYLGKKMHNGKAMLVFATHENEKQIIINPSYMSWAMEEETKMNSVLFTQMEEALGNEDNIGEPNNGEINNKTG